MCNGSGKPISQGAQQALTRRKQPDARINLSQYIEPYRPDFQNRLVSIDTLRGIAALSVTLAHSLRFQPFVGEQGLIGESVAFILHWGLIGVYLFFIISGFCIHLNWAKQMISGKKPEIDFIEFWKRRAKRLYPAYLVALTIYIVTLWSTGKLEITHAFVLDALLHATMTHNLLHETTFSINPVFWTLAVEEQLYLAYFLLLKLRSRYRWPVILLVAFLVRVIWFALVFTAHRLWGVNIVVFESAAALWFCWVLGALSVEAAVGLVRLPSYCTNGYVGSAVLIGTLILANIDKYGEVSGMNHNLRTLFIQPLWGVSFFILVNCVIRMEKTLATSRGLTRWLAHIGVVSYSLYLTHELFMTHVVDMLTPHFSWTTADQTLIALFVFTPISVFFARVFYIAFERPFLNRRPSESKKG